MVDRIDLGAGKNPVPEALTVDKRPENKPDVVHDLENTPYPFNHNQFQEVYMRHVLEHLENWDGCLQEVHRITQPEGVVHIRTPHFSRSIASPDHETHFSLLNFAKHLDPSGYEYIGAEFKVLEERLHLSHYKYRQDVTGWRKHLIGFMDRAVNHAALKYRVDRFLWPYVGGFDEIYWKLQPVK